MSVGMSKATDRPGLGRRPEARELPHRPEPAAIHRRVHAAGERIGARLAELHVRVEALQVRLGVQRLERLAGQGAPGGRAVGGRLAALALLDHARTSYGGLVRTRSMRIAAAP
jgi:hypothetical protein